MNRVLLGCLDILSMAASFDLTWYVPTRRPDGDPYMPKHRSKGEKARNRKLRIGRK